MAEQIKALSVKEIPLGSGHCWNHEGRSIAIFHHEDGFYAIDDECPHAGGSLSEGDIENGEVICPLHQWQFRLQDGQGTTDETSSVASYPVEVRDDYIWITLE